MSLHLLAAPPVAHALNPAAESIFRVLAYFDVFDFPLTADEILEYCDNRDLSPYALRIELDQMLRLGTVKTQKGFYFIGGDSCVQKRKKSAENVEKYTRKALFFSRLISRFPFVRCVCISGSLSKGCAPEGSDIDYFIITSPGRLWLCRTLLTLFKKTALLNSRKYFCINYFIDTDHLNIPDKNVFTATEIAFLLPTYHHAYYRRFMEANSWTAMYYPNKSAARADEVLPFKNTFTKNSLEWLLGGPLGDWLEKKCFGLNLVYRRRKFRNMAKSDFHLRMQSTRGVSKHHPNSFQDKVLHAYHSRLKHYQHRVEDVQVSVAR